MNLQQFFFHSLGICLNSCIKKIIATQNASKSVTGVAYITPSSPKNLGKISNKGNKNNICFAKDTIAPFIAFPIDGKKVAIETCIEFRDINNKNILIYLVAKEKYSSSPSPNKEIICFGKTWKITNKILAMQKVTFKSNLIVSLTL